MSAMDKHVYAQLDGCTTTGRRWPDNRCAPELCEGRLPTSVSQCDTWIVLNLGHRVESASIAPNKLIWRQQRAYVIHHAKVSAGTVQLVARDPIHRKHFLYPTFGHNTCNLVLAHVRGCTCAESRRHCYPCPHNGPCELDAVQLQQGVSNRIAMPEATATGPSILLQFASSAASQS